MHCSIGSLKQNPNGMQFLNLSLPTINILDGKVLPHSICYNSCFVFLILTKCRRMQILPHFFLPGIRETKLLCAKKRTTTETDTIHGLLPCCPGTPPKSYHKTQNFWAPSPCEKGKEQDRDSPIDRYRWVMRNSGRGGREAFKNRLRRSCNKIPLK